MDPRLGRFISVDPPMVSGAYLPTGNKDKDKNLPGMGGVFNTENLNVYEYGHNNPLKYIDPNGMEIKVWEAVKQKFTQAMSSGEHGSNGTSQASGSSTSTSTSTNVASTISSGSTATSSSQGLFQYKQSTGLMQQIGAGSATPHVTGYSGHGNGVNNPAMQNVPNIGPIPQGTYTIGEPEVYHSHGGDLANSMKLTPDPSNVMYGRGGFWIHAGMADGSQTASEGCIIFDSAARQMIINSGIRILQVIP
jgi:hypothetical protein